MALSLLEAKEKDSQYILGTYGRANVHFVRGEGSYLFDETGKKYLDLGSGIAVSALGHQNKVVKEAIQSQLDQFVHVSNLYVTEAQVELAQVLVENTPFDKAFFCNSGTEANEAMLKFCRKYWYHKGQPLRKKIVCFSNSFHGRTYGALSVTGQPKLQEGFGSMLPDVQVLPWNDVSAIASLDYNDLAGVILEPIQAEGGINVPSPEFISVLNNLRKVSGCLLLGDEIQCALGRLGTVLGADAVGLDFDMVSLAKPIGGGLPLGAVLLKEEQALAIAPGDHGTTFGGSPIACAAGLAVCKIVFSGSFLEELNEKMDWFAEELSKLVAQYESILGIKGKGFLIGLQTTLSLPDVLSKCLQNGLVLLRAGSDVIRFLPALSVSKEELAEGLTLLHEVLQEMEGS